MRSKNFSVISTNDGVNLIYGFTEEHGSSQFNVRLSRKEAVALALELLKQLPTDSLLAELKIADNLP